MSQETEQNQLVVQGNAALVSQDTGSAQFLTFILADENYGVDIMRVVEIKGWTPVTHIPNSPDYIKGVLNLRGLIVPIIDLRLRFALEAVEYTRVTVVIVVSIETPSGKRIVGLVVDGVEDVMNVRPEEIKPAPNFGAAVNTEFIRGMVARDDQMVMLLDIDRLLNSDEVSNLEALTDD